MASALDSDTSGLGLGTSGPGNSGTSGPGNSGTSGPGWGPALCNGGDTLLLQCLSSPRCINGCRKI